MLARSDCWSGHDGLFNFFVNARKLHRIELSLSVVIHRKAALKMAALGGNGEFYLGNRSTKMYRLSCLYDSLQIGE